MPPNRPLEKERKLDEQLSEVDTGTAVPSAAGSDARSISALICLQKSPVRFLFPRTSRQEDKDPATAPMSQHPHSANSL